MKTGTFTALRPNHFQVYALCRGNSSPKQDFIKQRKDIGRVEMVAGARPPRSTSWDTWSSGFGAVAVHRYLVQLIVSDTLKMTQNSWMPAGRCVTPGLLLLKNPNKTYPEGCEELTRQPCTQNKNSDVK